MKNDKIEQIGSSPTLCNLNWLLRTYCLPMLVLFDLYFYWLLVEPRTKLKMYDDRAFSKVAPFLCNPLPIYIHRSPTVACFKQRLKTYLFKLALHLWTRTCFYHNAINCARRFSAMWIIAPCKCFYYLLLLLL